MPVKQHAMLAEVRAHEKVKTISVRFRSDAVPERTAAAVPPLLCWPGDHCEVSTPDPIPNSAVNRLRANGTASIVAGE
jgi:hypothetical protein